MSPVTNPGFSSSRSSCWCQGGGSLSLHGICVLAAPTQAERHHSEVHGVLLPPLPHSKLVNSQVLFQDLTEDALSLSPSHSSSWWFSLLCCLHIQSKVLIYTSLQSGPASLHGMQLPAAIVYLAASQALPATYQNLSAEAIIGP